ncbi:MAG: T9SS type A sorting domain-containing protein, partial [Candidatus Marinimicrobia bacterium]|nr:T9SS type A sorting domain-containing protein [Candidatus Neomarinimicrobiota bacterium]
EQTILTNFLKDENSLFLSGQNVGEDLVENGSDADSIFYSDVLKAAYLQNGPGIENVLATGIEKDPVSNAFTPYFFLNGGNSESNQVSPDILGTVNGSVAMINYFGTGLMGKQAAIRYEDENYKLIYSAFGLEGINEIGTNNVSRQKLMINSILWLQGIEETVPAPVAIVKQDFPSLFKLGVNYPNPFNATTVIPLSFFNSGNFVFSIFNISGKLVFQKQVNVTKASTIEISWDGRNNFGKSLASGMYLYQIRSDNGMSRSAKMILMK